MLIDHEQNLEEAAGRGGDNEGVDVGTLSSTGAVFHTSRSRFKEQFRGHHRARTPSRGQVDPVVNDLCALDVANLIIMRTNAKAQNGYVIHVTS